MRTCDGCRFIALDKVGDREVEHCIGVPPTPIFNIPGPGVETNFTVFAAYPLKPLRRCGLFKRRWPWTPA